MRQFCTICVVARGSIVILIGDNRNEKEKNVRRFEGYF